MLPEAHCVNQHVLDGLRAMVSISRRRLEASGTFTTQLTCTADESIRLLRHARQCLQTLVSRSYRELCGPWRVALDVRSGLGASQLTRTNMSRSGALWMGRARHKGRTQRSSFPFHT